MSRLRAGNSSGYIMVIVAFQHRTAALRRQLIVRRNDSCAVPKPICLKLLLQLIRRAASRAACTAGNNKPTNTPMMAITTSNSTNVKARLRKFLMTVLLSFNEKKNNSCETGFSSTVRVNTNYPGKRTSEVGDEVGLCSMLTGKRN